MTTPVLTCPPTLPHRMGDSALGSWKALVSGTLDYWEGAWRRAATPLDVAQDFWRWTRLMAHRREPTWSTPHRIVLEEPLMRLRDFSPSNAADVVPTLVFPPQAGHSSCIVDYSQEQSQVKTIQAAGLERLWSLDWVGATQDTKDASIDEYIREIDRAVDEITDGPLNLVGDCQGGWLATIWAALNPDRVHTLTIAGAPVDFHAGEPVIHDYVQLFSPDGAGLDFYEGVVAMGNGVMKGEFMLNGFIAIKPENELSKQLQLLTHLNDDRHVRRYEAFEDWFKHTQDIPGAFYLWIVEHLFRDNGMVRGTLELNGERVDLSRITAPLYLLGGATDHITPPAQVFALAEHTATPPEQVVRRVTSGGHLGLFMGTEALRDHWPPLMADVAKRSRGPASDERARNRTPARAPAIPAP